jgi:hypothetical protein
MLRRRHRDQFDIADLALFNPRHARVLHTADANAGDARQHELGNCAERLDVQAQGHGRERRFERLHGINQPRRRQHHIDD